MGYLRSATAGAVAATAWGTLEPLDQRVFRCSYSDIALVGKTLTRGPGWRKAGFAVHALNGAVFGLVYEAVRRRTRAEPQRLALGLAVAEHAALWPLMHFVDRELAMSPRAFAQGTYRHVLFGLLLGRLS
jgi:hypothetical protein